MTDETRPATEATPTDQPSAEAAAAALADLLAAAQTETSELKDKVLRTLAEMENLRRRTEKEVKDARDYAVSSFARDLLAVTDTFDRALAALPAEARAAEGPVKVFVDGIEMTARELSRTLERAGVKKIEAMGSKFDPNQHQAMFELPTTDGPGGMVVQVLQDGFIIGERVLRPALVGVSKAAPKPAADAAAQPAPGVDKTV